MENFKDLSLKEAVQLRSEIGTQAFKMRDTNRRVLFFQIFILFLTLKLMIVFLKTA